MPYGIQQPAVSSQIIQLEESLGVTLFKRRPFELTAAGVELFQFIEPFFGRLGVVAAKLLGGTEHRVRVGASEIFLRDHLPALVERVRKQFPDLKLTMREGYYPQLEASLLHEEIDLALTLIQDKPKAGIHALALAKFPLVPLVNKDHQLKSADELWKQQRIDEPLIHLAPSSAIRNTFKRGIARLGVDWNPSFGADSLNLIETYVASGYGIGLSLQIPNRNFSPELRALPLPGFDPVTFGVLWCGRLSPVTQAFVDQLQLRAKSFVS
ncbi:MAG: LysR family transcriptional regulator [Chthoniobacterales bacterium]|nr:LysR family transcriptional regulator [Chthoniobacterales bacterium]